jgi:hypothetical protein
MDMAIGDDADGGDVLGPLERAKLSSVDIEGRWPLRPRGAYLVSIVIGSRCIEDWIVLAAKETCRKRRGYYAS